MFFTLDSKLNYPFSIYYNLYINTTYVYIVTTIYWKAIHIILNDIPRYL